MYSKYLKRELEKMYMYKEDFENILRKQRPSPKGFIYFATGNSMSPGPRTTMRNLVIFFKSRSIKKKNQVCSKCASNSRNRFLWKPVLQKGTSSCCVLVIHKASKHDHVIYCAAIQCRKSTNFKKDKLTYLTNLNLAPPPTAGKPKLRHTKED